MIEEIRQLLRKESSIFLAQVVEVGTAEESELLIRVKRLPDGGELVVPVSFSGAQDAPLEDDICVVVLPNDDADYAVVVGFLPSENRVIHPRVADGDLVVESRPGKKTNISSDTRVNIGKGGDTEESEPLVLGAVLTSYLTAIVADIVSLLDHVTTITTQLTTLAGNVAGLPGGSGASAVATALAPVSTALPLLKTKLGTTDKSTYLTTPGTNIKSQIAFTERGGEV